MKKTCKLMIGLALCTLIMLFAVSCSNKDVKPSRPDNLGPDETVNGFLKAMNNCNYEEVKLYIINGDKCDAHGIYNADTLIDYYSELPRFRESDNPQEASKVRPFSMVPSRKECRENLGEAGDEYYDFVKSIYIRSLPNDMKISSSEKIDEDEILYTIEYSVIDEDIENFGSQYEDEVEALEIKYKDDIESGNPNRMHEYTRETLKYSKLAYDDFFANARRKNETKEFKLVKIGGEWYVDYDLNLEF